jgi:hypothetical protein
MKYAKYISMSHSGQHKYESIQNEKEGSDLERLCGYVRISEFVEVEFAPLTDGSVVEKQLAALDKAESELRTKFQFALNGLEQQRQELRAIAHKPA